MNNNEYYARVRSKGFVKLPKDGHLVVKSTNIRDHDYTNEGLKYFSSDNSKFLNCKFNGINFDEIGFGVGKKVSEYTQCNFDNIQVKNLNIGRARFINCSFLDVKLKEFKLIAGDLIGCRFSGQMENVQINAKPGKLAYIYGERLNIVRQNDFTGVEFSDVEFRYGVDLAMQQFPQGPDYLIIPDAGNVFLAMERGIESIEDAESRHTLLTIIASMRRATDEGQKDYFFSKHGLPKSLQSDYELFHRYLLRHI